MSVAALAVVGVGGSADVSATPARDAAVSVSVTGTTGSDTQPENARIVIANADGTGRRVLADGEWSTISPDGARVAVTDWDKVNQSLVPRFSVYPSSGGPALFTLATDCLGVAWAPDSRKLACSEDMTTPNRLVVVDAATGSTTTISRQALERSYGARPPGPCGARRRSPSAPSSRARTTTCSTSR
jgi:hypothetical protein